MNYAFTEQAFRKLICSIRDKINGHTHDEFVTKLDLNSRGYLTESDIEVELDQFITEGEVEATIDGEISSVKHELQKEMEQLSTSIPTKTSDLINDNNFITDVELDRFTTEDDVESLIDSKGFVTEDDLDLDDYAKGADFDSLSEDVSNLRMEFDDHVADDISHITADERTAWNGKAEPEDIPTKVSELENDKGYLTSVPSEYITESELEAKKYLTSIPSEYLTESDVINNLTSNVTNQALSAKQGVVLKGLIDATEKKIPTKTSALTNDSGFLTSIPDEYVTETELSDKGYLTEVPSEYATYDALNNRGYMTEAKLNLGLYSIVKSVNNLKPDTNGNVDVVGEDGSLKHTHTWADIAATYEDLVVTSDGANHGGYVKVSNEVLTFKDIEKGGSISFVEGGGALTTLKFPDELTVYERTNGAVIAFNGLPLVVIAFEDGMTYMGNTFEKGISFAQDSIVITHTFRLNDYVLSSEITPIPPEYLPIDFLRQLILEVAGSGGEGGLLDSNGNYLYDILNNKLIAKE